MMHVSLILFNLHLLLCFDKTFSKLVAVYDNKNQFITAGFLNGNSLVIAKRKTILTKIKIVPSEPKVNLNYQQANKSEKVIDVDNEDIKDCFPTIIKLKKDIGENKPTKECPIIQELENVDKADNLSCDLKGFNKNEKDKGIFEMNVKGIANKNNDSSNRWLFTPENKDPNYHRITTGFMFCPLDGKKKYLVFGVQNIFVTPKSRRNKQRLKEIPLKYFFYEIVYYGDLE